MVKEFERDTTFRFPVNLVEHAALMSEDQIYAEFTGPDDSSERTLHSTKSQYVSGRKHIVDGPIEDAPIGFYRVTKLERRRRRGGPKVTPIEIPKNVPEAERGFWVILPKEPLPTKPLTVESFD
jgi:hypothetical protein